MNNQLERTEQHRQWSAYCEAVESLISNEYGIDGGGALTARTRTRPAHDQDGVLRRGAGGRSAARPGVTL